MSEVKGVKSIVQTYVDENLLDALQGSSDTSDIGLGIVRFVEGLLVIDAEKPMTREAALAKLSLLSALLDIKIDTSVFDK